MKLKKISTSNLIFYLLAITFLFGLITFLLQVFIADFISRGQEEKILASTIKYESYAIDDNEFDYGQCEQLSKRSLEIMDLKRTKYSYLNELKQLEMKRRALSNQISSLQAQIALYQTEIGKLDKTHSDLKFKILGGIFKAIDIEEKVKSGMNSLQALNSSHRFVSEPSQRSHDELKHPSSVENTLFGCTIEDCFDYSSCENGIKTRIHIFEFDYVAPRVLRSVDFGKLERFSIELVKSPEEPSCFTFIFMHDEKDKEYAVKIVNYLKNQAISKRNVVFIDVNSNITSGAFSSVEAIYKYFNSSGIVSSDGFDESSTDKISRSSVASFYNIHSLSSLFVHFSLNLNDKLPSANDQNSTLLIHRTRKFLLSFFGSTSSNPKSSLFKKLQESRHDIQINLECDSTCLTSQDTLLDMIDSTFTLILPDSSSSRWTVFNTERLITALKFQVIPVILDADLRLPLSDLIAWDELVVRLPQSQSRNLVAIISDMSSADIVNRQLKARNIFTSYFQSPTAQLQTLIAGLLHFYHIVPPGLENYIGEEFQTISSQLNAPSYEKSSNKSSNSGDIDDEQQDASGGSGLANDDAEVENESEYLGSNNPKPQASPKYKANFTRSSYLAWNRLHFPFGQFPSTPFDPALTNEERYDKYFRRFEDQLSSGLNPSIDELLSREQASQFAEYLIKTQNLIGGGDGKFFNYHLGGNSDEEQFTLIILSYKRVETLAKQLEAYVNLPYLNQIVVIWNDLVTTPPASLMLKFGLYFSTKKIRIIKSSKNSLNNRFLPYDLIETDAVLSLDNDILLRGDEIIFAFRVWRENRDRVVGFPARYHAWSVNSSSYVYQTQFSCEYSMILTGAAFYHRFYNFIYSYLMDARIREHIETIQNCEDIAFNMMVSHQTRKPPLKVTSKWNFHCAECDEPSVAGSSLAAANESEPLSLYLRAGHYEKRSNCVSYFISIYGYNPLLYSQYRADSVLYRTKVPIGSQKCFKYV